MNAFAGSDLSGTGVASPASCAFRSLTAGLASAQSASLQSVVAIDANPGNFAVFDSADGETFPIQIPAGVSLTTDVELAGNSPGVSLQFYFIDFDSPSATSAVELSAGSSIAGFTIKSVTTGNPAAAGVSCGVNGTASVADSLLEGPEDGGPSAVITNPGVDVNGQCSLSLSNVTVQNYGGPGVAIADLASAAIDGGTIVDNGWGEPLDGGCTGDGVYMDSTASLSIQNTSLAGNSDYGLHAESGTVNGANVTILGVPVSPAPNFGNVFGGIGMGNLYAPCTSNSSATVTLTNVTVDGVTQDDYDGVDVSGGQLSLLGNVEITRHGSYGLYLVGGTVYLENPTVEKNWSSGLVNIYTNGGAASLTVDGGVIGPNDQGKFGAAEVVFDDLGMGNLTLNGTTVQNNPAPESSANGQSWGINLSGPGAYVLTDCDITGNWGAGLHLAGQTDNLVFTGNRVHANSLLGGGNQVFVEGGLAWNLSGPPGCSGGQNSFYDYATGFVGIAVDGGKVVANNDSWQDPTPVSGVDYYGSVTAPTGSCGDAG